MILALDIKPFKVLYVNKLKKVQNEKNSLFTFINYQLYY